MPSRTWRSSALAPVTAAAIGSPCRVHNMCSRSPQKYRLCEAQYPYSAKPARSERLAVSRERPHSTGVESAIHTSSPNMLVRVPSARISQLKVPTNLRSRLLYPGCPGRYGNNSRRWVRLNRSQPGLAGETEKGLRHCQCHQFGITDPGCDAHERTPRQSVGVGLQKIIDLHVKCGHEGVQISVHAGLLLDVWVATSILDTLALMSRHQHQSHQSQLGINHPVRLRL